MTNVPADLKYQPFYCEENIWQLCQHPDYLGGDVIFIASYGDYFPMLCQQGSVTPNSPIFWDYHVVLLRNGLIHDFNSTLAFTTSVNDYFEQSLLNEHLLSPLQIPMFRVIAAEEFVGVFKSDRRHMKAGSRWQAEPPDWPSISKNESNLHQFVDMRDLEFGEVFSAAALSLETFWPVSI